MTCLDVEVRQNCGGEDRRGRSCLQCEGSGVRSLGDDCEGSGQ